MNDYASALRGERWIFLVRVEEVRNEISRLGESTPSVIAHSRPDHLSGSYYTIIIMSNVPPPYAPRDHAQGKYDSLIISGTLADA